MPRLSEGRDSDSASYPNDTGRARGAIALNERQHPPNAQATLRRIEGRQTTVGGQVPIGARRRNDYSPKGLAGSSIRPQIRRDNLLNLSISLGRGKETNKDSLSNGE